MERRTYTPKGNLLSINQVCPHCLKPASGRLKLIRFCPQCNEPVHRPCLKSTAPAHEGFLSHCLTLRHQGIDPADVFPQLSKWPRGETDLS